MSRNATNISAPLRAASTELGARLQARRKQLELTTVALSEAAGISRVTLHRIERGEPSVAMGGYLSVAAVLGLTLAVDDPRAPADSANNRDAIPLAIPVADYPELSRLSWQLAPSATLTPREALDVYERNWRHVDAGALDDSERTLIAQLRLALGEGAADV